MKILALALLLFSVPVFAQDNESTAPAAVEVAAEENVFDPFFLDSKTGCEPSFLRILSMCGMKFESTTCTYEDRVLRAGSPCEAAYRMRKEVCKADGVFDDSKFECEDNSTLPLRPLKVLH